MIVPTHILLNEELYLVLLLIYEGSKVGLHEVSVNIGHILIDFNHSVAMYLMHLKTIWFELGDKTRKLRA